jgi:mRNA interferase MazF
MIRPMRVPKQGDVVLLDFPGVVKTKRRPAIVVSGNPYHAARPDVLVGLVSTQINQATTKTDHLLTDWHQSGLSKPSAYRTFLATTPRHAITRIIGRLSDRDWQAVQECLISAFDLDRH